MGVSCILQIGHLPLWPSTTSGCIGHVHDTGGRTAGGATITPALNAMNSRRVRLVPPISHDYTDQAKVRPLVLRRRIWHGTLSAVREGGRCDATHSDFRRSR